jgi:hypothetical protein
MPKTPSQRRANLTPDVCTNARTKFHPDVKIVDSWESAIAKAKEKIARLKEDVLTFQQMKRSGEPWPGTQVGNAATHN